MADPMRQSQAILETDTLTQSFKGHDAVAELNWGIEPGEAFALLRPHGAGKTTSINVLPGFPHVKLSNHDPH
jgi:ABC-type branched-subunit amino acid transport system ATPase component